MATVKKSANKATTAAKKTQTLEDKIIEILKNNNWTHVSACTEGDDDGGYAEISSNENSIKISYNLEEYPFTCGMKEIGSLDYLNYKENDIEDIITIDRFVRLLVKALKETINSCTNGDQKFGLSCTIPYEDEKYTVFELALQKLNFKNVGEFKNKNSGNNLRHYILI